MEPPIFGLIPRGDHLWICNVLTSDFEDGDEAKVVADWGLEIIVKKTEVCHKDATIVSDNEDANNNRENVGSSKRKKGSKSKINDSQILPKILTTEENEYYFFNSFIDEISKVSF